MADAAADDPRSEDRGPNRRCLLNGTVQPPAQMVRFVIAPSGIVTPDVAERLPGRGFWLSADRDVIDRACARNVFARAARAHVTVPGALADDVERLLVRRCQDLIGLARRAKRAVVGYAQTRQWLDRGAGGVLLAASDGSAEQLGKMRAAAGSTCGSVVVIDVLSAAELGGACGRGHVVHGAIAAGSLADNLVRDARRLEGLRRPNRSMTRDRARSGYLAAK